jgi:hypothetical protein
MQHAFNQLLQFLQQGISAIFHFVQMIWTWSVGQISTLLAVPWQQWPLYEADPVSVGAGWRNLGIVQSCDRTLRSWRADSTRIRAVTYRSCTHVAEHRICVDCSWGVWLINHLDNNLIQLPVASNQLSTAPASSNHSPSNEQSSENR